MHLIAEQDEDLHVSAVEVYMRLLDKPKLPPILQEDEHVCSPDCDQGHGSLSDTNTHMIDDEKVICWVLGEYGSLASQSTTLRAKPQDVMSMLVKLYGSQRATDNVRALTITALAKIVAQTGTRLGPEAEELLHKASCSQNLELQQRAYELQAIVINKAADGMSAVLPADASCEDFEDHEMQQLPGLTFLNGDMLATVENAVLTSLTTVVNVLTTSLLKTVVNVVPTSLTTVVNVLPTSLTTVLIVLTTSLLKTMVNVVPTSLTTVENVLPTSLTTVLIVLTTSLLKTVVNVVPTSLTTVENVVPTSLTFLNE
eukprot:gene14261-20234_t